MGPTTLLAQLAAGDRAPPPFRVNPGLTTLVAAVRFRDPARVQGAQLGPDL